MFCGYETNGALGGAGRNTVWELGRWIRQMVKKPKEATFDIAVQLASQHLVWEGDWYWTSSWRNLPLLNLPLPARQRACGNKCLS